jgi:hypothetical protein
MTTAASDAMTSGALSTAMTLGALSTALVPVTTTASLAVNVASVKTHVPVVLDLTMPNYSKWRMLIGVLIGRYELSDHITTDTPIAERTAEWTRLDYIVRSWLYGSVSEDILDIIMAENQTAFEAYALICNLFLDNQLTCTVYLKAKFRALVQGDLTITAFCHHLKSLADALCDVGQFVTDQTMVLTCLRGLNPRFSDITTLVTMQRSMMSLLQTRCLLLLHENQLAHAHPASSQVALYGHNTGSGSHAGGNTGSGGGHWQKKKKPAGPSPSAPRPWICFNPHMGQTQPLQANWQPTAALLLPTGDPGVLGPWPIGPRLVTWVPPGQQAYPTQLAPFMGQAFGVNSLPPAVPYYPPPTVEPHYPPPAAMAYYPPAPSAPGYDAPAWYCTTLIAALNNTTASSSNNGGWVMDSGATSHMVSDPGIISSPTPPSLPSHVTVGNGFSLPICTTGHTTLSTPHHTFCLNNVLVVPTIIKNLLYTHQFTIDNSCSVEYDPFGFSIKDLQTRREIIRCSSSRPLYEFTTSPSSPSPLGLVATTSATKLWHRRLGHPRRDIASHLAKDFSIPCNKATMICHACMSTWQTCVHPIL